MQIPFRQGIVQCSHNVSNQPNFLQMIGGNIYIDTTNSPLLVTFSQGPSEYLLREKDNSQILAFTGPFLGTLSYWFYWDLNVITGIKTYGYTNLFPVFGPVAPPSPAIDQHWFNTLTNGMFVWNGTAWVNKIRVFAGNLENTQVTNQYALIGGNNVLKTFYVSGNVTAEFVVGDAINIIGGGLNTGAYNVTAYVFNVGLNRSEISVSQTVPSPIFTGYLTHTPTVGLTTGQLISYNTGTQVGNNTTILSGFIFYDQNGQAVKLINGQFFTTQSAFIISAGQTQPIQLEDSFIFANASQNLAAYQVVSIDTADPTKINPATYEDTSTKILGIALNNALLGQQVLVALQGVIDNPLWTWLTPNITLWVDNGVLVTVDPYVSNPTLHPVKAPPVARTINSTRIYFDQGMGGLGLQGPQGLPGTAIDASATQKGVTKLSLNPVVATNPIAVGDNDPRNSDARPPLAHNQAATTITVTPVAPVIPLPTDLQTALGELVTDLGNKVNRSGDSMSGSLIFPTTSGITVTGLPNPILASDAVPLGYLLSVIGTTLSFLQTTAINGEVVAIPKCSPVYVFAADTVKLARANASGTINVIGLVADNSIPSLSVGSIAGEGFFTATTAQWDAVTGQVGGLTAGATYYLSDSVLGGLTTTVPVTIGNYIVPVGIAMTSTKMKLTIKPTVQI